MFNPRYTITNKLLANIKYINSLILDLNNHHFPITVLVELERTAQAVSTYASTSIEGNPLPLTDVKRILKTRPQNIRKSEQEVLNYNRALEKLNRRLKLTSMPLTLNLILSIHKQVTYKLVARSLSGKLRDDPIFVNDPKTNKTVYLPPDAKDVLLLMTELIKFINDHKRSDDPLILAGIFHKQFVIIHPFMDGNGRTGRLATKVLLAEMGLNTFNLFSFENYYNKNVTNYFNHVGVYGNYYDLVNTVDFTKWLEYFTDGIIDELLRVKKELSRITTGPETELKPYHQKILDFIKEKGYITDRDYAKFTLRAKATRVLDFKFLLKMGLIVRKGEGRATYYKLKS